jgi:hypothetical protein
MSQGKPLNNCYILIKKSFKIEKKRDSKMADRGRKQKGSLL